MDWIDLRSDTVTLPTPEMRQAMANADLGDDVLGEDPTVYRLEALMAGRLGKQAGLFVPSGTMGNLIAVLTHCGRGDEVILGNLSHTFLYEAGGMAALGGVHPYTVPNQPDGTLQLNDVVSAIRPDNPHFPISRLICLENTHNRCGGVPLTSDYTRQVGDLARQYSLKLHLDGARIFNAAIALGISAAELAEPADSVMVCLSKALCAPVGSVLCGDDDFIRRARRVRKQLGGGMRQAGVIAAAGIVALEKMVDRLIEDHQRARSLADRLRTIPGLILETEKPATNMVYLQLEENAPVDALELVQVCSKKGIKLSTIGPRRMRLVVHYWINDQAIDTVVGVFKQAFKNE
ncbi:MAG TPA: low-specificity L-threonine aldolase [Anaerolineae bacterium]|nr:low-specificity L-threonine aldolase [Anaerolineae bacterium]